MKIVSNTFSNEKPQQFHADVCSVLLTNDFNPRLLLVEMQGAVTSRRAIWASIVGAVSKEQDVKTPARLMGNGPSIDLYTRKGEKYKSKTINNHLVMWSTDMNARSMSYFIGGDTDTPSPYFGTALQGAVKTIPFLETWLVALWKRGLLERKIIPLNNMGTPVSGWAIIASGWTSIIKEMIHNGEISSN